MRLTATDREILNGMFRHMMDTDSEKMTSVVQTTRCKIMEKRSPERAKYTIKIKKEVL